MRKQIFAIGCLIAGLLASTPAWVEPLLALKSTTVDLPSGDSLFPAAKAPMPSTTTALPAIRPIWC